jgi:protein phosphatase
MQTLPAHPEPVTLRWWGRTDVGRVRKNNEDAFLCLQFDAQEVRYLGKIGEGSTAAADFVFAVSDGMGGAKSGEFASRTTVEKITKLLPRAFKQGAVGLAAGHEDVLEDLFEEIHKAMVYLGRSYEECAGMGATLSLGWFTPGWMHFAHIGDSRIYFLPQEGGIRRVTHDDTYVDWMFRNGQLTERQAREHPRRNALQKALGAGQQFLNPHVGAVAYEPGDIFLLCSDGLVDGLFDTQILDRLRNPDGADAALTPAERLVAASLATSGKDNTTALIVEVG